MSLTNDQVSEMKREVKDAVRTLMAHVDGEAVLREMLKFIEGPSATMGQAGRESCIVLLCVALAGRNSLVRTEIEKGVPEWQ